MRVQAESFKLRGFKAVFVHIAAHEQPGHGGQRRAIDRFEVGIQADAAGADAGWADNIGHFFDADDQRRLDRAGGNRQASCPQSDSAGGLARLTGVGLNAGQVHIAGDQAAQLSLLIKGRAIGIANIERVNGRKAGVFQGDGRRFGSQFADAF